LPEVHLKLACECLLFIDLADIGSEGDRENLPCLRRRHQSEVLK
jgi:hypothetical protein